MEPRYHASARFCWSKSQRVRAKSPMLASVGAWMHALLGGSPGCRAEGTQTMWTVNLDHNRRLKMRLRV